jgi:TolB-like protein
VNNFFQELRRRNVVRVAGVYVVVGWVLVQIATTLEESIGLPQWFDGLIVSLLLLGLPVALIFAWAFELTPEGVVRTQDVPEGESITRQTGRRLDYAIIFGIIALGAIMLWRGSADAPPGTEAGVAETATARPESEAEAVPGEPNAPTPIEKSIAVLPFENRSPNPDDAFFADGMHDDLLTHLSKIRDMHVISRTSVMGYANTERRIPDIGRELGVATVMEGAVQRAGNRVRINVQLIDAATDAHLWAEIYDRELTADNLFDIQSEITQAIADALHAVLSSSDEQQIAQRPTASIAAYDAYLEGRLQASVYFGGVDRFRQAVGLFDRAIELDPDFAEAYAYKAYSMILAYWYVGGAEWRERAQQALQEAEQLAPDAVETLTARGYYHYWGFLDYASAEKAFSAALAVSPNFILAISGDAFSRRRAGDFDAATMGLEKAHRLDPRNVDAVLSLAETYARLGRFDDARGALRRASNISTLSGLDLSLASLTQLALGDTDGAWQTITRSTPAPNPSHFQTRVIMALATRDPEKIRRSLEQWPADMRRPYEAPEVYAIMQARALLFLGEDDEAAAVLAGLQSRLAASENPFPQGWAPNAYYFPVDVAAMTGDIESLRAAVADFETNAAPDAWGGLSMLIRFAGAFATAGDPDAAFDYIDRVNDDLGAWTYAELSVTVEFDSLHDDPRWRALEADYEDWLSRGTASP